MFLNIPVFPQHGSLWDISEAIKFSKYLTLAKELLLKTILLHNFIFSYLIKNIHTNEITSPVISLRFCIHTLNLTCLFHICKSILKHTVSDENGLNETTPLYIHFHQ